MPIIIFIIVIIIIVTIVIISIIKTPRTEHVTLVLKVLHGLPGNQRILIIVVPADTPSNVAPAALQRASTGQPPHAGQPTLSHWVAQKWAVRWASGGWPPLHLLFYRLTLLSASFLFPSLILASTSELMPPSCPLQWHESTSSLVLLTG